MSGTGRVRQICGSRPRPAVMRARRNAAVILTGFAALGGVPVAVAGTEDDQATADAAMAAFNERMVTAGFVSDGPIRESSAIDPEEAEFVESECMRSTGLTAPVSGDVPGQTAIAFSDELQYAPQPTPSSTDSIEPPEGEAIRALVITVDAAHRDDLDNVFDYITSEARIACLREFMLEQFATLGPEGSAATESTEHPQPQAEVSVELVSGIGDRSARIDMFVSAVRFDTLFVMHVTTLTARSQRSMVLLTFATSPGGPFLDVHLDAELATIVGSL